MDSPNPERSAQEATAPKLSAEDFQRRRAWQKSGWLFTSSASKPLPRLFPPNPTQLGKPLSQEKLSRRVCKQTSGSPEGLPQAKNKRMTWQHRCLKAAACHIKSKSTHVPASRQTDGRGKSRKSWWNRRSPRCQEQVSPSSALSILYSCIPKASCPSSSLRTWWLCCWGGHSTDLKSVSFFFSPLM